MATRHADRRERPMSFAPHAPIQRPRQKARQGGALVPCEPKFLGTEFSLGDAEAVPVVRQYFADARPAVLKTEAGCRRLEPVALGRRGQRSARRVPRPDPVGELRDPVGELRDAVDVVAPLRREATSPATRRGGRARGDESCRSRTTRKQEPPGGIAIDAEVEQPRPVRPAPDRADRQADAPQVRAGGIGEIARGHGLLGEQPGHRLEQLALRYLIADPPGPDGIFGATEVVDSARGSQALELRLELRGRCVDRLGELSNVHRDGQEGGPDPVGDVLVHV